MPLLLLLVLCPLSAKMASAYCHSCKSGGRALSTRPMRAGGTHSRYMGTTDQTGRKQLSSRERPNKIRVRGQGFWRVELQNAKGESDGHYIYCYQNHSKRTTPSRLAADSEKTRPSTACPYRRAPQKTKKNRKSPVDHGTQACSMGLVAVWYFPVFPFSTERRQDRPATRETATGNTNPENNTLHGITGTQ